jgi:hypothetical protein
MRTILSPNQGRRLRRAEIFHAAASIIFLSSSGASSSFVLATETSRMRTRTRDEDDSFSRARLQRAKG